MSIRTERLILPRGTKVPDHIAIVPDGNRRWARARGLHTLEGHKKGFERAVEIARASRYLGINTCTIWGFSTENWDRSPSEVRYLMKLYEKLIDEFLGEAKEDGVRIIHLGRKDRLPAALIKKIEYAEKETCFNRKHILNVAIDYGGHDDIIRAVKGIVRDKIRVEDINEKLMESYLDTKGQPYPYVDLLIRTSGEQRTSGLLLWQMEYAEMYWEQDHLPDFTPEKLKEAILDYSRRRRRFGADDSVSHFKFRPEIVAKFEIAWWRLGKIPEGTKFIDYAMNHLKEQYGLSKKLAKEAAVLMLEGVIEGKREKWEKSKLKLKRFYRLIRDEVKLAFEPSVVASLDVKISQKTNGGVRVEASEIEDTTREFLSEVYRISEFQAAKAAHLRALATVEKSLAERGGGERHWAIAQDYLEKYYKALKDRVA
jgi:undecaprenyl diphosphate synthase